MKKTPKSLRLQIGLFGRTNVGKSSFLNLVTGQDAAITSSVAGTTTDVVEKPMELLPIGPVMFLDTGGIDDTSVLAEQRTQRTKKIFGRSDIAILITEPNKWGEFEDLVSAEAKHHNVSLIVVINKIDEETPADSFICKIKEETQSIVLCSSVIFENRDEVVIRLKEEIIKICPEDFITPPALINDLMPDKGLAALIIPIDIEAPKGRIILPQVQTIRDALDGDSAALIVKEHQYSYFLNNLKAPPDLVVCDSQVVDRMVRETPSNVKCTTFSILFSRYKGDLIEMARGTAHIHALKPGDKVLVAESCSHHAMEDDIGRVKMPKWFNNFLGGELQFDVFSGRDYPENLKDYKLVILCGSCMITRRETLFRIQEARRAGIPVTNYGLAISLLQEVLERVLEPFPLAKGAYLEEKNNMRIGVEV